MTPQFYTQKPSFKARIISSTPKLKSWPKVFMALLISFVSLSSSAQTQTITNVVVSPTVFCPGSKGSISFTVTNGVGSSNYFTASTSYLIYMSNGNGGNFSYLISLPSGSTPPSSSDGATATITLSNLPVPTVTAGTGFRVSIGSTSPTFDGSTAINKSAPFTIAANPTISLFQSICKLPGK